MVGACCCCAPEGGVIGRAGVAILIDWANYMLKTASTSR